MQVLLFRHSATVARVGKALQAVLVAVVNRRHAGEGHLHERREPKAALGQAHCAFVQTPLAALAFGQLRLVGAAAEHRDDARTVVARQQVERTGQSLARIVLAQGLDVLGCLVGVLVAHQKADDHVAEGVVHGRIELGALQVAAQMAVANLVGGVLPDLAEQQRVGLFGKYCLLDLGQEVVGKLVSDVQAPTMGTGAQPFADHAVLAQELLAHQLGLLVDGGHVAHAPPAVVRAVLVEGKRVAPRRILALPGAHTGVVAIAVEVDRVIARVVEDAVQDDGNAKLLGCLAQLGKVLLGAQDRVDLSVVGRVVAMIARRLKDGVEVDGRKAQLGDAGQVFLNALERSAVEVPGLDGAVLGTLIDGWLVPILDHAALNALTRFFELGHCALAPMLVTGVAVGEDLIDHAALVPGGTVLAVLVDGNLEGRHLGVVVGYALAAGAALRCAQADLGLALDIAYKAVPDKTGFGARKLSGKDAVALMLHGDEGLADAVDPGAQGKRCLVGIGVLQYHRERNGSSSGHSAKRSAKLR